MSSTIGGQDLVEEYLTVDIWPLTFGWEVKSFLKVKFGQMTHPRPCPYFGLEKPAGLSDEMVVVEIEHKANALLGAYNKKERKAFVECCSHGSRINRCFFEMGVKYKNRETPPDLVKRGRGQVMWALRSQLLRRGRRKLRQGLVVPPGRLYQGSLPLNWQSVGQKPRRRK